VIRRATWDCSECRRMSRTFVALVLSVFAASAVRASNAETCVSLIGRKLAGGVSACCRVGSDRSPVISDRWSADSWRSEAFDGRHGLAVENASVAIDFMREPDVLLQQIGKLASRNFQMRIMT